MGSQTQHKFFVLSFHKQSPKKKATRGKKRQSSSSSKATVPPEDQIEEARRAEILAAFQEQVEASREGSTTSSTKSDEPQVTLSYAKKALKRLGLEGIKSHEIQEYFGSDDEDENSLETMDPDMFLRFAAAKTIQKNKSDKAFALMDGGGKGIVLVEDLQRVSQELGEDFSEEELQEMIEFVDPSGEGLLTTKHFFKIARQTRL
jgi:Ca2+-binding EF-hand superfamily protein